MVLVTEGHGPAKRLVEVLGQHDVPARIDEHLLDEPETAVGARDDRGRSTHGFLAPGLRLAVLTYDDLTGTRPVTAATAPACPAGAGIRSTRSDPGARATSSSTTSTGSGRYVEMTSRTVQGATREYLVHRVRPVQAQPAAATGSTSPPTQLEQVTRYVGGETPALDRIGGADWARRKGRARRAVRQIAAELIKLYAARQAAPGHAFGPDTPWQRELEDAFPYVETPDQLSDHRRGQGRHGACRCPMDRVDRR